MTVGDFVDKLSTKKSVIVRWMDNDGEFHGIDVQSVKDMDFDKVNDIDLLYNDLFDKFYINLNVDKKYIDEYTNTLKSTFYWIKMRRIKL